MVKIEYDKPVRFNARLTYPKDLSRDVCGFELSKALLHQPICGEYNPEVPNSNYILPSRVPFYVLSYTYDETGGAVDTVEISWFRTDETFRKLLKDVQAHPTRYEFRLRVRRFADAIGIIAVDLFPIIMDWGNLKYVPVDLNMHTYGLGALLERDEHNRLFYDALDNYNLMGSYNPFASGHKIPHEDAIDCTKYPAFYIRSLEVMVHADNGYQPQLMMGIEWVDKDAQVRYEALVESHTFIPRWVDKQLVTIDLYDKTI